MKRILYTTGLVMIVTFLAVWWFGTGNYYPLFGRVLLYAPVKGWSEYFLHFVISWFTGMAITVGMALLIQKILKVDFLRWNRRNFRALTLGLYFFSLLMGAWMYYLFHGISNPRINSVYEFLLIFCILGGFFYLLSRVVEAMRNTRIAIKDYDRTQKKSVSLFLKLFIMALFILIVTFFIPDTELSQYRLFNVIQKRGTERNDYVRCLELNSIGLSHTQYLNALAQISKTLTNAGVKVIIAPLPEVLGNLDIPRDKVFNQIDLNGNVVFAIPVSKNINPFAIDFPIRLKKPIRKGVISATTIQNIENPWLYPKYYPLSYWDLNSGEIIPDVAVEAVRIFLGNVEKSELRIKDRTFSMSSYRTGLMKDQSTFIQYRIIEYTPFTFSAEVSELTDSIKYSIYFEGNDTKKNPVEGMWSMLDGKIVIIDPGPQITKLPFFRSMYTNIIHNILENESTMPLNSWTPFLTGSFLILSILLILFLRPWQSLLWIILLVIGQWFLYIGLASAYNVIVEPKSPIVGTLLGLFAFSFVRLAHDRKLLETNEKKRLLEELQIAHDMQMGLMPTEDPQIEGFDVSGICLPANEVGGDYFDYVWLDETKNKLGIAVADVSGKAMKAAITAVMTSGMVYREVGTNETPKSILTKINRPMYLKTDKNVFTALSFAIIDLTKKELTLSNAGQMPPLLRRGDMLQSIKVDGPRLPLGVKEAVEYNEVSRQLQSSDVLILYTDGIIEAKNVKEELWGFERMEEAVKNLTPALTAKEMCEALVNQATQFAGSATQHDDMTVVVVKVL